MAGTTKKQPQSSEKSRSIPVVGIVFAVVAVLAVVAVVFAGNTEPGSEYGEPQIQGQLSQMPPNVAVDTSATGQPAPIVIGADFDGNEVRIENDGRAKAIVLLAHWCPHCQNEVPEVQAWLESGGGVDGVDLYSVATSMNSSRDNYPSSEWLDREGWTVPVVVDDKDNSVYLAYGAGGFPFWVFLNSDGTVAARAAGRLGIDQIEQFMNGLS
ncbi:MAG: TlpA disulfide reductase family protein [Actinomycetota bacterium]|nr:TlpA disulfide reductase family protein [Actinomycetota bacterium]